MNKDSPWFARSRLLSRLRLQHFTTFALVAAAACTQAEQRAPDEELATQTTASVLSDTSCDGYRQCIATAEPRLLASRNDVRRDSLRLVFTVAQRPPVELVNGDPAQEDSHYYLYNGWDSTLSAHRVYLMEYESSALLYVFLSSGAVSDMDNLPLISPSGRYLAASSWDTEAQMDWNRASVFRILPDSLVLEWEIVPTLWGPDSVRWLNDSTLVIQRGAASTHPNPAALNAPLTVTRINGTWRTDSSAREP